MTDDETEAAPEQAAAPDLELVPMDKLARVYRKMQAEVQRLTTEYETQIEAIKAQQEGVKIALKDHDDVKQGGQAHHHHSGGRRVGQTASAGPGKSGGGCQGGIHLCPAGAGCLRRSG